LPEPFRIRRLEEHTWDYKLRNASRDRCRSRSDPPVVYDRGSAPQHGLKRCKAPNLNERRVALHGSGTSQKDSGTLHVTTNRSADIKKPLGPLSSGSFRSSNKYHKWLCGAGHRSIYNDLRSDRPG